MDIIELAREQLTRLLKEKELLLAQFILQNPDFPIENICIVHDRSDPLVYKYYLELQGSDKERSDA